MVVSKPLAFIRFASHGDTLLHFVQAVILSLPLSYLECTCITVLLDTSKGLKQRHPSSCKKDALFTWKHFD